MKFLSVLSLLILGARLTVAETKQFTLKITSGKAAPDGNERDVYLINGRTPGPPIEVTQGDEVEVTVVNEANVRTTIHFHGIEMKGTPWSDGVPGITMKLIAPGNQFIHKFKATNHGLYWYHAHSRTIYGDGARGHIIVHPNAENLRLGPWSLISSHGADVAALQVAHRSPKILAGYDWTHWTSEYDLKEWNRTRIEPLCVDSMLINGKGRVLCPAQETLKPYFNEIRPELTAKGCAPPTNKIIQPFQDAKPELVDPKVFYECQSTTTPFEVIEVDKNLGWASIGFINMGALWDITYSIDDHPLYIYAADGQYHKPQIVDAVNVPPGERYVAMIRLDKDVGDYTIRAAAVALPQVISGYAVLSYKKTAETENNLPKPKNPAIGYGANILLGKTQLNPVTLAPFPESVRPPVDATTTIFMYLKRLNSIEWSMNNDPFAAFLEEEDPLLFNPGEAKNLDPDLVPAYPVGSIVDVVLISVSGNPPHPIHKHGTKAFVIAQAKGDFPWSTVAEAQKARPELFNLENPSYRDGFQTLEALTQPAFLVIRYVVTEPSVTFFHCHINIHLYGGMAVALVEGPDAISGLQIPEYYKKWNEEAKADEAAYQKRALYGRRPSLMARFNRIGLE